MIKILDGIHTRDVVASWVSRMLPARLFLMGLLTATCFISCQFKVVLSHTFLTSDTVQLWKRLSKSQGRAVDMRSGPEAAGGRPGTAGQHQKSCSRAERVWGILTKDLGRLLSFYLSIYIY